MPLPASSSARKARSAEESADAVGASGDGGTGAYECRLCRPSGPCTPPAFMRPCIPVRVPISMSTSMERTCVCGPMANPVSTRLSNLVPTLVLCIRRSVWASALRMYACASASRARMGTVTERGAPPAPPLKCGPKGGRATGGTEGCPPAPASSSARKARSRRRKSAPPPAEPSGRRCSDGRTCLGSSRWCWEGGGSWGVGAYPDGWRGDGGWWCWASGSECGGGRPLWADWWCLGCGGGGDGPR